MHVQIVLFDGFDLLDAIAPYEVFTSAALYTDKPISVAFVSAEGKRTIPSGDNQVVLQASAKLDINQKGIIVVPGASGTLDTTGTDSIPAKLQQATETDLPRLLEGAMENPNVVLATVCGGSLILAMAGLLEGRHAVTHHLGMKLLGATGAIPIQARVVADQNLITAGGVTSGLDLALYLVEGELGPRIAHAVEQLFEYERRGTVWKAEGDTPIVQQQGDQSELPKETSSTQSGDGIDFQGLWDTTISTPVGKMNVLLDLKKENNRIVGTAKQGEEIVTLDNPALDGDSLTWTMKVTKPIRLTLTFIVTVKGNKMRGIVKAGMLPSSKLVGKLVS